MPSSSLPGLVTSFVVAERPPIESSIMDALSVYAQLENVRRALDAAEDHAIAAYIDWAMTLIDKKYGVSPDRTDATAEPYRAH